MKRAVYLKENLTKAIFEYKNGAKSSEVASKYGIPSSTVRNHGCNSQMRLGGGRPTLLTNSQEQHLIELFKSLENVGVNLTKTIIIRVASDYVQFIFGKSVAIGRKWLKNFLTRWKGQLNVIDEKTIDISGRNSLNENDRACWLQKLYDILLSNNMMARPYAIFMCDTPEFTNEVASNTNNVDDENRQDHVGFGNDNSCLMTSLICGNAAGDMLPPFIIYSATGLIPQWTSGGPQGSWFATSKSGRITKCLFLQWFKWFIEYTKSFLKPILLIMNNHDCYINIEVIETAKQNNVLLLLLPLSRSRRTQPLTITALSSLKQSWKRIVMKYLTQKAYKTIGNADVPPLFAHLYSMAFKPKQVQDIFMRAGIWPCDLNSTKDKLARQPLVEKQPDQLLNALNVPNHSMSSIQPLVVINNIDSDAMLSSSSLSLKQNEEHTLSTIIEFDYNENNQIYCVSDENNSNVALIAPPDASLLSTSNVHLNSSSIQVMNATEQGSENRDANPSCSSLFDPCDLLRIPSYLIDENFTWDLLNDIDMSLNVFNDSNLSIHVNEWFGHKDQSNENRAEVPATFADSNVQDKQR